MNKAGEFIKTFDMFIKGLLENMNSQITLIITSDHGNMEDLSTGSHTCNHVPLIAVGKRAHFFIDVNSITDIFSIINVIFK